MTNSAALSALIKRINRKLRHEGEMLHRARGDWDSNVGDYYISNDNNWLVACHVDPVECGHELGVLSQGEYEAILQKRALWNTHLVLARRAGASANEED